MCGGAVLETPRELNDGSDFFYLPLVDTELSVDCQLLDCCNRGLDHDWHSMGGGNPGRFLRTLHMSLIC